MKGLLIKDILVLRKSIKTSLPIIIFAAVYSYATDSPAYMLGMITLIFTMMPITSMTCDDMSKWDRYALTMPISRRDIVVSKYILSILLSTVSIIVSTTITYIFIVLPKDNMDRKDLLLAAYLIFFISLVYVSIMLPLIYKFGVERTRILFIAVLAIPGILIYILYKGNLQMPSEEQLLFLLKISPFMLIIILFISAFVSNIIYKNKDI